MVLCKCGHEQSKHTTNGCVGCSARCRKFEAFVITEEEKVRRQEIIASKLKQAAEIPVEVKSAKEAEVPEASTEMDDKEYFGRWICPECDVEYDTRKEAKDCCESEDKPFQQYICECGARYDTVGEAKTCDCSGFKETPDSSESSGSGLGLGGIVQMMMMFVVLIIVVSMGSTIIGAVQPMAEAGGASPAAMTAISAAMPLMSSIIPLVVGVGIMLTVLTYITGSGTRS